MIENSVADENVKVPAQVILAVTPRKTRRGTAVAQAQASAISTGQVSIEFRDADSAGLDQAANRFKQRDLPSQASNES